MTNQSRRQFLKTGALFGAASAAAAVSAPAFSTEAPQKWDETTGLLIVGTGFAGCRCPECPSRKGTPGCSPAARR